MQRCNGLYPISLHVAVFIPRTARCQVNCACVAPVCLLLCRLRGCSGSSSTQSLQSYGSKTRHNRGQQRQRKKAALQAKKLPTTQILVCQQLSCPICKSVEQPCKNVHISLCENGRSLLACTQHYTKCFPRQSAGFSPGKHLFNQGAPDMFKPLSGQAPYHAHAVRDVLL